MRASTFRTSSAFYARKPKAAGSATASRSCPTGRWQPSAGRRRGGEVSPSVGRLILPPARARQQGRSRGRPFLFRDALVNRGVSLPCERASKGQAGMVRNCPFSLCGGALMVGTWAGFGAYVVSEPP
jgi:hypothetical protein